MHSKQDYKNFYGKDGVPYDFLNRMDRLEEMVHNLTDIVKKQQEKEAKMIKEISTHKKIISHLIQKLSNQSNKQSSQYQYNKTSPTQSNKLNKNTKNVSFQQQHSGTTKDQFSPYNLQSNQIRSSSVGQKMPELTKSQLNMGASLSSVSGSKILMNQLIDLEEKQATLEGNLTGSYVDYETLHANNRHKKNLYGIIYDLQRLNKPDYDTEGKLLDDSEEFDENYLSRRDSALDIVTRIEYLQHKLDNHVTGYKPH